MTKKSVTHLFIDKDSNCLNGRIANNPPKNSKGQYGPNTPIFWTRIFADTILVEFGEIWNGESNGKN